MNAKLRDYFQNYNTKKIQEYCIDQFENSIVDLHSCVEEARNLTIEYARTKSLHYVQRNFMAENMYCNTIGVLYDHYPELMNRDKDSCPYLKLANDVWVFPKKLNSNYIPSNIITARQKRLRGQELFDEQESKIHILYVGPVLSNDDWYADIKGVYASYINEYYPKKTEWIIDLQRFVKKPVIIDFATEESEDQLVKTALNSDQLRKQKNE